jgi:hypothetical protein
MLTGFIANAAENATCAIKKVAMPVRKIILLRESSNMSPSQLNINAARMAHP